MTESHARTAAVEIRVFGSFEVRFDDRVLRIGSPKLRLLLATLTLHANHIVSADRVVDVLWSRSPPEDAQRTVQKYVHRLRCLLADTSSNDGSSLRVETRPPGYVLVLDSAALDADRFVHLIHEAGRVAITDPTAAIERFDRALQLWRGPPWQEFADLQLFGGDVARLDGIRVEAIEDRAEAGLALGRHRELILDLQATAAELPLRECPREQLMVALYRSGRQVEALRVFHEFRSCLIDEVGLEPSATLQQLADDIIQQKPHLDLPNAGFVSGTGGPLGSSQVEAGTQLPTGTVTFLLTDVVGSTRLWDDRPTRWRTCWRDTTTS